MLWRRKYVKRVGIVTNSRLHTENSLVSFLLYITSNKGKRVDLQVSNVDNV